MQLDYGTLLCPDPIKLSIGSLRKPTLRDIYGISFDTFSYYESFLKMQPRLLFTDISSPERKAYWESLSEEQQNNITMYDAILSDVKLQGAFAEILDFFFVEKVIFRDGFFFIMKEGYSDGDEITDENVCGLITAQSFQTVSDMIQQTCCIYEKPKPPIEELKFKNNLARRLHEKMQKAKEEQDRRRAKMTNKDHTLPNIISAVSNRHPNLNPNNVWNLTVFQLIDSFNRLQTNAIYDINWTRVSVWGDEKKTFDLALWYKNNFDD